MFFFRGLLHNYIIKQTTPMADKKPFKINWPALPTTDARQLFNPGDCFARGGLTMGADGKPVLTGNCQVAQFGKNRNGNNCMFVCQTDFSEVSQRERPVLASFVFDHMGRVIDLYYGNSAANPSWKTNVHDGTRASFGFLSPPPPQQPQIMPMYSYRMNQINTQLKQNAKNMSEDDRDALQRKKDRLKAEYAAEAEEAAKTAKAAREAYDELIKTPRWGCTRVLKGPLEFLGCQRRDRTPYTSLVVEGFPYVSCVEVFADFDKELDVSQEAKIKPYFKHDPVTGKSEYGASGYEFYDGQGFGNVCGNTGFRSFVVLHPSGTISTIETRQGTCPNQKPVPPSLSVSNPETRKKFEVELRKGHGSVLSEMRALKWLETNPLVFPEGPSDETFADSAFVWIHKLSMQFKEPGLSLSSAAMAEIIGRRTSSAAWLAPAMRSGVFASLVQQPATVPRRTPISCNCTPTNRDPMCLHQFCQFRHAAPERLSFVWPRIQFASCEPAARSALEGETLAAAAAAAAKQQAAAAAAEAAAAKQQAAEEKKAAAAAAKQKASEERKAAAAAAPPASLRGRRTSSAAPSVVASSAAPSVVASSAAAVPASAARKRTPSISRESTKKKKGGSKSKSKSKRRVRK